MRDRAAPGEPDPSALVAGVSTTETKFHCGSGPRPLGCESSQELTRPASARTGLTERRGRDRVGFMAYRLGVGHDRPEEESAALQALGKRRSRWRSRLLLASLATGVGAGAAGLWLVTQLQWAVLGRAWILVSVVLGFFPPLIACGAVGLRVARWVVSARTSAWVAELAAAHRVDRGELAAAAALVEHVDRNAELDATED
jgi:hypothetical protein